MGGGARVMSGLGENTKNMEVQIKIYDGGVENGDLTFIQGR